MLQVSTLGLYIWKLHFNWLFSDYYCYLETKHLYCRKFLKGKSEVTKTLPQSELESRSLAQESCSSVCCTASVHRTTSNRSTPTPGWGTVPKWSTCRSQTRSPPSYFAMPAFNRQCKSSSPDSANLGSTVSPSFQVNFAVSPARRLSPARGSVSTFPLSVRSVRVASSWRSADCQAEWLTSVQVSLLHALVANGKVRSRRARSEVARQGFHSASELRRRVERRCVRLQGSLLVVHF